MEQDLYRVTKLTPELKGLVKDSEKRMQDLENQLMKVKISFEIHC